MAFIVAQFTNKSKGPNMKSEKVQTKKPIAQKRPAANMNKKVEDKFPINIPESQGDLADQAELQIEADLDAEIEQARNRKNRK